MKKSLFLFLCLMIVSLFPNRILYAQETAETPGHTLTIYLDRQNQMAVRMAIGIYEKEKKEAEGTEQASYYPEIQWNLVDKSGLEPEAFQTELEAELEAGGGPDLIFVDRDSTRNPYELMAQGCFWILENSWKRMRNTSLFPFIPELWRPGNGKAVSISCRFPLIPRCCFPRKKFS